MKTITDYLKQKKSFICDIGGYGVEFQLKSRQLIMKVDGQRCVFNPYKPDICCVVQTFFEDITGMEIRFCEVCGKPFDAGFIAEDEDWYCCEECFEPTMDNDYGKGNWRSTDEEGEYGGFYEFLGDNGEWQDTGVYWAEWN